MNPDLRRSSLLAALTAALLVVPLRGQQPPTRSANQDDPFRFKSGVELINVTTTVTDSAGRFVSGLHQEDFRIFEDDQPVEISHFSTERIPVSLGIILDTSGSMAGPKMQEAQSALDRFLYDLLDKQDEIFLYRFSNYPSLVQGWTSDRAVLSRALARMTPNGGTAMYDAIIDAIPLGQSGQNKKKALLVISDGNDTASRNSVRDARQAIRESELMVYAIGIDGDGEVPVYRPPQTQPPRLPIPFPFPPGRRRFPELSGGAAAAGQRTWSRNDDRVNVTALREMTDDSGGRTEIIRDPRDLNPATASIADELSKQYYLGYASPVKKDGRWHSIRVEVRNTTYRVRARRGYVAS